MPDKVGGHGAQMRSWVACLIILAGFVMGGIALIYWNWPTFWVSVGVVALGFVVARAVNIMEDVTEYGAASQGGADPEASY